MTDSDTDRAGMNAPEARLSDPLPGYRGRLTRAQVSALLRAVNPAVVEKKQNMSYFPQQEARAALIRIFGPGGADHTMTKPELLYRKELQKGEPGYPVKPKEGNPPYYVTAYMAGCTMRVYDYWGRLVYECTEWHVEENAPLPNEGEAHAMAVTSAQSYALRRSLISLGDAFGLHLYNKGQATALAPRTFLLEDKDSPLYKGPDQKEQQAAQANRDRLQKSVNSGAGTEATESQE